jgi:hypothetical protein
MRPGLTDPDRKRGDNPFITFVGYAEIVLPRSIRPTGARLTARRFLRLVFRGLFLCYHDRLRAVHRNRWTVITLTLTLIIVSRDVRRGGLDLCLLVFG